MELQFLDRVLTCSDCRSDFIFTAGEQLFFHEKQFKNDPKRCKNCKARRAGLSNAAAGAEASPVVPARTETRTNCSDCGVETTVPFKPTQGRPVLCRQCYQKKLRIPPPVSVPGIAASNGTGAGGPASAGMHEVLPQHATLQTVLTMTALPSPQAVTTEDAAAALAALPARAFGQSISPEAALMAATSISGASAQSSVATLEDLESMASGHQLQDPFTSIPLELLQDATPEHVELLSAVAETAEA